jgi:hypothetical protein
MKRTIRVISCVVLPKERRPHAGKIAVHFFRQSDSGLQAAYPYFNPTRASLHRLTRVVDQLNRQDSLYLSLSHVGMGWCAHLRVS